MTNYRFAILAGVSSDAQASEDKQSIPDQIKKCRKFIAEVGGKEAVEPFIMDGYSRAGYDGLNEAMKDIPPLAEAVKGAAENLYDILLVDNYDRLGDIAHNLHTRFNKYKKQIYSIRQSGRLFDPDDYDPSDNETADISIAYGQMIQAYRMKKLRRAWKVGMPARINAGLHPLGRVPCGYSKTSKTTPPAKNNEAEFVIHAKDMFLDGRPFIEIATYFESVNLSVQPKKQDVFRLLKNPFYAGWVVIGRRRTTKENGKHKVVELPMENWTLAKGKHTPLWDEETYFAILDEYKRRYGLKLKPTRGPVTGLVYCGVCGEKMYRAKSKWGKKTVKSAFALKCKNGGHLNIRYDKAIDLIADAIIKEIQKLQLHPINRTSHLEQIKDRIARAETRRKRVQEGYEAEEPLYTQDEATGKMREIEAELRALRKSYEQTKTLDDLSQRTGRLLESIDLQHIGALMKSTNPAVIWRVNKLLSSAISKIVIYPYEGGSKKGRKVTVETRVPL